MDAITQKAINWMESDKGPNYDPLVTYLFINKTLDMTPGKVAVQTARAGQVMLLNEMHEADTLLLDSLSELTQDEFMHGNKTITLKANANQMQRLLTGDTNMAIQALSTETHTPIRLYPVYDVGQTEVPTNSLTVIAMTPVPLSIIKPITKKYQLYH